jgi:hypothetical protein
MAKSSKLVRITKSTFKFIKKTKLKQGAVPKRKRK